MYHKKQFIYFLNSRKAYALFGLEIHCIYIQDVRTLYYIVRASDQSLLVD